MHGRYASGAASGAAACAEIRKVVSLRRCHDRFPGRGFAVTFDDDAAEMRIVTVIAVVAAIITVKWPGRPSGAGS
jgi:hypothetical protein